MNNSGEKRFFGSYSKSMGFKPNNNHSVFLKHFKSIYQSSSPTNPEDLGLLFPEKISESDNNFLCTMPIDEEILATINQISSTRPPGPDCFIGLFYKQYSDIVKEDLNAAIKNFFVNGHLLR